MIGKGNVTTIRVGDKPNVLYVDLKLHPSGVLEGGGEAERAVLGV